MLETRQSAESVRRLGADTILDLIDALQPREGPEPSSGDAPTDGETAGEDSEDVEDI